MATTRSLMIGVGMDVARLQSDVQKATRTIEGFTSKIATTFKGLGAAIAAHMSISTAKEFMEMGAKAMQAEAAFRNTAESVSVSADKWSEALQKATNSTVDSSDLMLKAMKGVSGGLKWEDTIKLAEVARTAARRTGEDVGAAYSNIMDSVETMRTRALRAYGLITKDQAKWIEGIKSTGQELDVMQVILTNAAVQQEIMGNTAEDAAERIQKFQAMVKDLKEEIGIGLITEIMSLVDWFNHLGKTLDNIKAKGFLEWYRGVREETFNMLAMSQAGYMPGPNITETKTVSDDARKRQEEMNKKLKSMSQQGSYNAVDKAIQNLMRSVESLNPMLTAEEKQFKKIEDAIADINRDALEKHIGLTMLQKDKLAELSAQAKEYISTAEMLKAQIPDLDEFEFFSGEMGGPFTPEDLENAKNYIEGLERMRDEVDTLNVSMELQAALQKETFSAGMVKAVENMNETYGNFANIAESATMSAFNAMGNTIANFCTTGRLDFQSFAESVISSIAAMIAQMLALKAIMALFGFGAPGKGGLGLPDFFSGGLFHGGGIVGVATPTLKALPASTWRAAPRLHSGLASDEVPAILQKGETVIPKGKTAGDTYIFNVKGSLVTEREFAREIIPLINKAKKIGAH